MNNTTIALTNGGIDFRANVQKRIDLSNCLNQILARNLCVLVPGEEREIISFFREHDYHNLLILDLKETLSSESFGNHVVCDRQKYEWFLHSARFSLDISKSFAL